MSRKRLRIFEKITKKKQGLSLQLIPSTGQADEVSDLKQSFVSDASEISVEEAMTPDTQVGGFLCIKV